MFMKKFTKEEENEYKQASENAKLKANKIYEEEIRELDNLKECINKKSKKDKTKEDTDNLKAYTKRLKEIDKEIIEKTKLLIKEYFDYQIAFAKVDKAGINNTGGECENELIRVLAEFKEYESKNHLWNRKNISYRYFLNENNNLERSVIGE